MGKLSSPHHGSMQFWPRKRAEKQLPSVNWKTINVKEKTPSVLGFISYKVGMASAIVKDNTENSMTKGKKIVVPVTILEAPNMKIFSIRFYKNNNAIKETIVSNDKELKKKLKLPKEIKPIDSQIPKDYDDMRVIAYSLAKQTSIKKTPDMIELAVHSNNKLEFAKSLINKEITLKDFAHFDLLDTRGLTIGKGLVGPVKRFGINLKQHKTEKGIRRPGSLGPWHPARVTFVTPMAGQLGLFSRVHYNFKVINHGSIHEKDINLQNGFKHYGKIKSSYIIVKGSVQGPPKRQILLTPSFRPTKLSAKKKYEFQELII
nr:50S ribosomal protein L3P [uncultured archaeon]